MLVMKRYCDYDYDNNCIILFDAADADKADIDDELNIRWISSGDNHNKRNKKDKKEKKGKKEKTEKKEKTGDKIGDNDNNKKEKVPLYQYLEIKHQKKMKLQQAKLYKKSSYLFYPKSSKSSKPSKPSNINNINNGYQWYTKNNNINTNNMMNLNHNNYNMNYLVNISKYNQSLFQQNNQSLYSR